VLRIYFRYYRSKYSVFSYCIRSVPLSSANRNTIIFLSGYTAVSKLLSGFGQLLCLRFYLYYLKYIRVIAVYKVTVCYSLDGIPLNLTGILTVSPGFAFTVSTLILTAFESSVGVVTGVVGVVGTVVSPTFTPPSKNCVLCSTRSLFANPPTSTNLITLSR